MEAIRGGVALQAVEELAALGAVGLFENLIVYLSPYHDRGLVTRTGKVMLS